MKKLRKSARAATSTAAARPLTVSSLSSVRGGTLGYITVDPKTGDKKSR